MLHAPEMSSEDIRQIETAINRKVGMAFAPIHVLTGNRTDHRIVRFLRDPAYHQMMRRRHWTTPLRWLQQWWWCQRWQWQTGLRWWEVPR